LVDEGLPNEGDKKGSLVALSATETKSIRAQKAKKDTHPEFHAAMAYLESQIGHFPDWAAQGGALNKLFKNGITLAQIEKYLPKHVKEFRQRDLRPTYLTLGKYIYLWIKEEEQKAHHLPTPAEKQRLIEERRMNNPVPTPGRFFGS
jgi:hypothetical protein